MALKIISADERIRNKRITGVIFGEYGIGKTTLLMTLNPDETLFINIESGETAVPNYKGRSVDITSWDDAKDLACLIAGHNIARRDDESYSAKHYQRVLKQYGGGSAIKEYEGIKTLFIDSITDLSRIALHWCKGQPESFTDKGRPNNLGLYGLLGQELITCFRHLQHAIGLNVWFVGALNREFDEYKRPIWTPQIEGQKTAQELPGIVDQVITMANIQKEDKSEFRALICNKNQWNYPAKDRSGRLNLLEEPNLGKLMNKIKGN
jgi:hypothetical protein